MFEKRDFDRLNRTPFPLDPLREDQFFQNVMFRPNDERHRMSRVLLAILFTLFAAVPGTLARVGTAHYHAPSQHARSQLAGRVERSRKVRKTHRKRKHLVVEGPAKEDTGNVKIVDRVPSTNFWENIEAIETASTRVVDGKKQ
jgi:hypothetical protein